MFTFTKEADWPVRAAASSMLKPCSFTRRITSACAGLIWRSSASKDQALVTASPWSATAMPSCRASVGALFCARSLSIHLCRATAASQNSNGRAGS